MAFHLPFSYRRRFLPKTDEQTDFSGGMIRDAPLHQIPANAAYTIHDFLIDQHGQLYRRGPFSKWSSISSLGAGGAYGMTLQKYPLATNSELVLVLDFDGTLYRVTSSAKTSLGSVTALSRGCWAFLNDKTIYTPGDTIAGTPKKITFDGTTATLASLGGTPPTSSYCAVYKSRVVLASDQGSHSNRVWFSPVPNVESTWDTTNSWIDCDNNIRALVPLRNMLLVFGTNSIERIIGDTPPPGSNMDRTTISNIGLSAGTDGQSAVAVWNDNAIFANATGVWMTDGGPPVDLTAQGGIKTLWRSIAPTINQTLTVGVYRNTVLVASSSTSMPGILCFDLLRRAWYLIGGNSGTTVVPAQFSAGTLNGVDELLFIDNALTQSPILTSGVFAPTTAAYTDISSNTAAKPRLTTRVYTGGGLTNQKRWSWAHITHDLRDPAALNPTWTVTPYYGIEATTPLTATTLLETFRVGTGNLLPNPSFESASTGWTLSSTTVVSGLSQAGTYHIEGSAQPSAATPTDAVQIDPTQPYCITGYFKKVSGAGTPLSKIQVNCYDSSNNFLSTVFPSVSTPGVSLTTTTFTPSASWVRYGGQIPSSAWPAGTTYTNPVFYTHNASTGSSTVGVDAVQFEQGATATTFSATSYGPTPQRKRVQMFRESQGIQLDIQLTTGDTASEAQIYAVEVEGSELPYGYEGQ